jgi:hypothetical protein
VQAPLRESPRLIATKAQSAGQVFGVNGTNSTDDGYAAVNGNEGATTDTVYASGTTEKLDKLITGTPAGIDHIAFRSRREVVGVQRSNSR